MLSEMLRVKYFQTSLLSLATLRSHSFPWGHCQVQSGGLYKMSAAGVGTAHSNSLRQLYTNPELYGRVKGAFPLDFKEKMAFELNLNSLDKGEEDHTKQK